MLQHLSVKNFILIDELELSFEQGFSVITGETGAGKSILLDAILFCLGGKSSSDVIKQGAESASVTAVFSTSLSPDAQELAILLEVIGIEFDNELVIKRLQSQNNRKKFLINDHIVTQKTVEQVAAYLFELHGQNSHSTLLSPAAHIDILDNYGNLFALRSELAQSFNHWQNINRQILEISNQQAAIEREIDYLAFVVEELTDLSAKIGEEDELASIKQSLQNYDKEVQTVNDLLTQLAAPEIDQVISKALRMISRSGKLTLIDETEFVIISNNLDDAYNNIENARLHLKSILNNLTPSEYTLEQIEDRLYALRSAARKYAVRCDELPTFLQESETKLKSLNQKLDGSTQLSNQAAEAEKKYYALAKELSEKRRQAAGHLQQVLQQMLAPLKMAKATFLVEFEPQNPGIKGTEAVRFIASTNPGMAAAPIDKIASGGELSRFMLAIKTALFDKNTSGTIIFDEIDTGIGGVVADSVGEHLKKLAQAAQVIVITHQPQVAGKANQHILVHKVQMTENTIVSANTLSKEERALELARMISGKAITESSLRAAQELLHK